MIIIIKLFSLKDEFCYMETKIRITKEFKFEMAHALDFHEGKCKNIHGHSYTLSVRVFGKPNTNNVSEKGMVMDFTDLKKIVNTYIIDEVDHALMLHTNSPYLDAVKVNPIQKLKVVDYQPTCENMLIHFSTLIRKHLPNGIMLHSLHIRETPTSYAEWYAEDNH